MIRVPLAVAAAAVLLAAVAACGPVQDREGSPSVDATSTASPSPVGATSTASPSPVSSPAPRAGTASPDTLAPSPPVEEDESLLAVLPEAIDGTVVAREPLAFQEASGQADFAASIGSAVFFVAPGPSDLVSGLVAKPRDGVYSESWYRDWRETYDDGACAQAGGVGGRAEAPLDGRPVSITTCAGGLRVYHAWIEEQGVVVSLIALGDNRWGEEVMSSLRP